jgi:hypothetical protein
VKEEKKVVGVIKAQNFVCRYGYIFIKDKGIHFCTSMFSNVLIYCFIGINVARKMIVVTI